jgi:hypothetical protein
MLANSTKAMRVIVAWPKPPPATPDARPIISLSVLTKPRSFAGTSVDDYMSLPSIELGNMNHA